MENSATDLDQRLISFKGLDRVSTNTVEGRETIPVVWGEYAGILKRKTEKVRKSFYVNFAVLKNMQPWWVLST